MSWPVKTLGEVAHSIRNGIFARRPTDEPVGNRILRISAVRDGSVNLGDGKYVADLTSDQLAKFSVRPGDLLVTRYNGSRPLVGTAGIVPPHNGIVLHPDKLIRVVLNTEVVDPRFVNYQFQSRLVRAHLEPRIRTTAGQSGIAGGDLRSVPLVLPPVDQQRRIVDILEDHLSRLDSANAAIDRCARRVSAMKDAFLARCVRELTSVSGTQVVPLGEISQVLSGATPLRSNSAFYLNGTIPWITSGDLHQGLVTKPSQFVTEAALATTNIKLVPAGSLLIAMYGEGRTRGTVAELGIDATTNQACAAVVLDDPELRAWVRLVLDANYTAMRRMAAGGVQPNLNLSLVRSIEVPIPPESIRATLLGKLIELNASRKRLSAELSAAKMRSNRLRGAILAAAFSGRLTGSSTGLREVETV